MLKSLVISGLILTSSVFAIGNGVIASNEDVLKMGTEGKLSVTGVAEKTLAEPVSDKKKTVKVNIKKTDLKDAFIMSQILKSSNKETKPVAKSNFLALPSTYSSELKEYNNLQKQIAAQKQMLEANKVENERLVLLRCSTFKDYKIYNAINMNMVCRDRDSKSYKLNANITVSLDKVEMISKPYLMEDEMGRFHFLDDKSKIYNATSGSSNLATYIDKRVFEKVSSAMAGAVGNSAPELTKDYLEKKNAADSTTTQAENGSTVVSTTTPEPEVKDYGISLLVDVLSSGVKAGVDQLYKDLGYIYFIPKGSVFDAQIVIKGDSK